MKHFICLVIIMINIFAFANAQNRKLEKVVSKYVEMEVDMSENPGIIIGIIEGDSVYVYSFGEATKGKSEQIADSSIFDIGSMTKVFTASLLQIMVDNGKIDYKKTLADYLGKENLHPSLHNITVWHLATHTSGLSRVPTNFSEKDKDPNNPFAHYTDTDLDFYLKNHNLLQTDRYLYSHTNYALIERIIEKVAQKPIQTVLNEQLFTPLNLENTTHQLSEQQHNKLNTGYLLTGEIAPESDFSAFYGAIGLKSDMNDLLKFVQGNMNVGETLPPTLLQSALAKTQVVQVNTGVKKYIDTGIGWHIIRPKKRYYNVISHRGTGIGHQAYIAFLPETKTGVIVLANSRNSLEGLGYFALKMVNKNWKRKAEK